MNNQTNHLKETKSDRYLFKRFFQYMSNRKKLVLFAFVLILLEASLSLIGPYLWAIAIDEYILKHQVDGLLTLAFLYILTYIGWSLIVYFMLWTMSVIGYSAIYHLRKDTFDHLQELGLDYYDETPTGQTMARVMNDISTIQGWFGGGLLYAVAGIAFTLGAIIVMFTISITLTLLSLAVLPFLVVVSIASKKYARAGWAKTRTTYSKLTESMTENIMGIRVSHSFAKKNENIDQFNDINQNLFDANQKAIRIDAPLYLLYQLFAIVGTVIIYYFGGSMIIDNVEGMTIGKLFLFITYQTMFIAHLTAIVDYYSITQSAFASFERVITLQDTPTTVKNTAQNELICKDGKIEFLNVNFAYRNNPKIIEQFNLTIPPSQKIAIVGETGSGKTTIGNLITRFYDVQEGKILIDNQDIKSVTLNSLRNYVSVILQEPFLFSGSIRENLLYGSLNVDISDGELEGFLSMVGADFVFNLQKGLDTDVGERGSRLSLGQRQLVSFARALVPNPKILIFDEATSSVDSQTELKIQKNLEKMVENRSAIIIAHRLSTIRIVDRIIVLDNGKIIEDGTFDELIAQKGKFYELYTMQIMPNDN